MSGGLAIQGEGSWMEEKRSPATTPDLDSLNLQSHSTSKSAFGNSLSPTDQEGCLISSIPQNSFLEKQHIQATLA